MTNRTSKTRREFLRFSAAAGAAAALAGCSDGGLGLGPAGQPKSAEDVSPAEDLMREHGALIRILLVYEECLRRMDAGGDWPLHSLAEPAKGLAAAAKIVRQFVEDYHEKLEEEFVFPRLRGAGKLVELVETLAAQHNAGRRLTDVVLRLAAPSDGAMAHDDSRKLQTAIGQFVRMYKPHLAREDTVLFPAFHDLVPPKEYDELGDRFEARENQLFGEHGFEHVVEKVADIEKSLGIYELAAFTPKTTA